MTLHLLVPSGFLGGLQNFVYDPGTSLSIAETTLHIYIFGRGVLAPHFPTPTMPRLYVASSGSMQQLCLCEQQKNPVFVSLLLVLLLCCCCCCCVVAAAAVPPQHAVINPFVMQINQK